MLSLFNLNIMHGRNRKSAVFPARLSRQEIQANLQKIVDCIHKQNSDIVTLQEVDRGSVLSGSFDQFEWLSKKLQYPYKYFAPSCSITLFGKDIFVSGNAIFSRYPLVNCKSCIFEFSFPTDRMGFVIADAQIPGGQTLTIVSLHLVWLDWMRPNSRARQLELVQSAIGKRKNNIAIAGDFNCEFVGKEASLKTFTKNFELVAYEPDNNLATYPSWNPSKRIDWILTSKGMRFMSYETLENKLSDHLVVFAMISTKLI